MELPVDIRGTSPGLIRFSPTLQNINLHIESKKLKKIANVIY